MLLVICLHAMVKIVMQLLRSYVVKYCREGYFQLQLFVMCNAIIS